MSTVSPPEAFPVAEVRRPGLVAGRLVKSGGIALAAGTAGLAGGIALHRGRAVVAASPEIVTYLARLEAPLVAAGQVLLIGGTIDRRLARRRQDRDSRRMTDGHAADSPRRAD